MSQRANICLHVNAHTRVLWSFVHVRCPGMMHYVRESIVSSLSISCTVLSGYIREGVVVNVALFLWALSFCSWPVMKVVRTKNPAHCVHCLCTCMQYSQEAGAKIKSCINYLKFKEKTLADKGMPPSQSYVHTKFFFSVLEPPTRRLIIKQSSEENLTSSTYKSTRTEQ